MIYHYTKINKDIVIYYIMKKRRRDGVKRIFVGLRISEDVWNDWATKYPDVNRSEYVEKKFLEDLKQ